MRRLPQLILSLAVAVVAACASGSRATPAGPPSSQLAPAADRGPAPSGAASAPLKLGVSVPLTGAAAALGVSSLQGIQLAVQQVNDAGGPLGRPITLVVRDDAGSPDTGAGLTKRLVRAGEVFALLGAVHSSVTAAEISVTQEAGLLHLTPAATAPSLVSPANPFFWRAAAADRARARALLGYARAQLGLERLFLLRENSDYGQAGTEAIASQLKEVGQSLAGTTTYYLGDRAFDSQLDRFAASGAEALVLWGGGDEPAMIARQARTRGLGQPILVGDGFEQAAPREIAGPDMAGLYFPVAFDQASQRPVVQRFVRDFVGRFGREPDHLAAQGYDAVLLLAESVRQAGGLEAASAVAALEALEQVEGVQGQLSFDDTHDLQVQLPIKVLDHGRVVPAPPAP